MADIIIIAALAAAVFFVLRSLLGKRRRGQCAGGCAGCGGCGGNRICVAGDNDRDVSGKEAV